MKKTVMFLFALAVTLNADSIGVAVNGTCEAGSCPAVPLSYNSTATLPVDFTVTLPDGDRYLIDGSFTSSNNGNGAGFGAGHLFQVTFEGNVPGGTSEADTINVQADFAFDTTAHARALDRDVVGAFGP